MPTRFLQAIRSRLAYRHKATGVPIYFHCHAACWKEDLVERSLPRGLVRQNDEQSWEVPPEYEDNRSSRAEKEQRDTVKERIHSRHGEKSQERRKYRHRSEKNYHY